MTELTLNTEELNAITCTLFRLEQPILPSTPDASVYFAYDPLPIADFFSGVQIAVPFTRGRRFLDIGCGIGTKLMLMHYLGWEVAGIDRHEPYVKAARKLIPEASLTCADLRDVGSFTADFVYMYRPGVSDALEDALERHVISCLTPGTVLYLPLRTFNSSWGTVIRSDVGVIA